MTDKEKIHEVLSSLWKNDTSVGALDYNQALQDAQTKFDLLSEEPVSEEQVKESAEIQHVSRTCKENGNSLTQEPVSEDLEVVCEQLAENARKHKAETSSPFFSQTDYRQGIMDGAKWQKEKLVERVCEWLGVHMPFGEVSKELRDEVIEDLKKELKKDE